MDRSGTLIKKLEIHCFNCTSPLMANLGNNEISNQKLELGSREETKLIIWSSATGVVMNVASQS